MRLKAQGVQGKFQGTACPSGGGRGDEGGRRRSGCNRVDATEWIQPRGDEGYNIKLKYP